MTLPPVNVHDKHTEPLQVHAKSASGGVGHRPGQAESNGRCSSTYISSIERVREAALSVALKPINWAVAARNPQILHLPQYLFSSTRLRPSHPVRTFFSSQCHRNPPFRLVLRFRNLRRSWNCNPLTFVRIPVRAFVIALQNYKMGLK